MKSKNLGDDTSSIYSEKSHGPRADQRGKDHMHKPLSQIRADFWPEGPQFAAGSSNFVTPTQSSAIGLDAPDADDDDIPLAPLRSSFGCINIHPVLQAQGSESEGGDIYMPLVTSRGSEQFSGVYPGSGGTASLGSDISLMECDDDSVESPLAVLRDPGVFVARLYEEDDVDEPLAPLRSTQTIGDGLSPSTAYDIDGEDGRDELASDRGVEEGSDVDALESDSETRKTTGALATFVVDPDDMQDYGIEARHHIPAVPTEHGNYESFDDWQARSPAEDVQRERRAVQELGRIYQKADRLHRLLLSLRDSATGLLLSPYVGAASALQGSEIQVLPGTSDAQASGSAQTQR